MGSISEMEPGLGPTCDLWMLFANLRLVLSEKVWCLVYHIRITGECNIFEMFVFFHEIVNMILKKNKYIWYLLLPAAPPFSYLLF